MSRLRNLTTGEDLAPAVRRASNTLGRLIGLLGSAPPLPHQGLWLEPCSAVHTFGMRGPIDIVLLDREHTVVALRARVKPNRPIVAHHRAASVIEMGAGFLTTARIAIGDRLCLEASADDDRAGAPCAERPRNLLADDAGATMVEYALIITLLAVAVLAGVNSAGGMIKSSFNAIGSAVGSA